MKKEPILVVVRDGSTKVYSLDTSYEVYIIVQRGCTNENPPALYRTTVISENIKPFRETIKL